MLRIWPELIYLAITFLDTYVADEDDNVDPGCAGRGGPQLRQRPRAAGRHVPFAAPDARGDGQANGARRGAGALPSRWIVAIAATAPATHIPHRLCRVLAVVAGHSRFARPGKPCCTSVSTL